MRRTNKCESPNLDSGWFGHLRSILMRYRKLLISPFFLSRARLDAVLFLSSLPYFFLLIAYVPVPVESIDCFKCSSLNGSNPACEDPFHNNHSTAIYESPCMGGRKGRDGLYPATACIKLSGHFVESLETITVRDCALDSGTLNTDTEIIRMSHCGHFYFEEKYVKGCLKSCDDADGCNRSPRPSRPHLLPLFLQLVLPAFHCIQILL